MKQRTAEYRKAIDEDLVYPYVYELQLYQNPYSSLAKRVEDSHETHL